MFQIPQQLQVLLVGLGEAETRIPDDLAFINAGLNRSFTALQQRFFHICHDIGIGRELIHGLAVTAAVHQHHRTAGISDHPQQIGIPPATAYIIDPVGPCFQCLGGHRRQKRVDGDQCLWAALPDALQRW